MEREFRYIRSGDEDADEFTRRAWFVNAVSATAIVFAVLVGSAVNAIVFRRGKWKEKKV